MHNTKFHKSKRSFLTSVLGLIGLAPFMRFFKNLNKKPYFFLAHLHGRYIPKPTNEPHIKRNLLKKLNNKALQQGKLIKYRYIPAPNKTSWLYVFNSYESYKEWESVGYRLQIFSKNNLPKHIRYSDKKGFLNPEDLVLV